MTQATSTTGFLVLWGGVYAEGKGDDGLPFTSREEAEEFAKTAVLELGPDECAHYDIVTTEAVSA